MTEDPLMKMPVRVFHKLKATNFKSEIVFSENRNVTLALQHISLSLQYQTLSPQLSADSSLVWASVREVPVFSPKVVHQKQQRRFLKHNFSVEDDGDYSLHEEGGGWKPYLNTSDQQFSGGLNLNEPALSSPSLVFWWSDKSSTYEK